MQTQMMLHIAGAERGEIVDKESGAITKWAALHTVNIFDGKNAVGTKTERVSAAHVVYDQLATMKLPAVLECIVELKAVKLNDRNVHQMRVTGIAPQRKAA